MNSKCPYFGGFKAKKNTDKYIAHIPSPCSFNHFIIVHKYGFQYLNLIFLNLDEIDWIEAAANYVRLSVGKESYLLRETISRTSERLNPNEFIRIHRSVIVNVRKIKELIPVNSGEYIVVLKSGKELSCSRGYRALLQRVIERNS